jgi:hypothetical protein
VLAFEFFDFLQGIAKHEKCLLSEMFDGFIVARFLANAILKTVGSVGRGKDCRKKMQIIRTMPNDQIGNIPFCSAFR